MSNVWVYYHKDISLLQAPGDGKAMGYSGGGWISRKEGRILERKKKLVVFSADAMVHEDIEYLSTLPNFKKYLAGGCMVKRVSSVYPTITYPCHTTMISGVWPDKHGVAGNIRFAPGQEPMPWKWSYDEVLWKEDIFTAAKKAGYTTGSVFWPMTGNHPCIDYLIDEYWARSPEHDTPREAWRQMGSKMGTDEAMLAIAEKYTGNNSVKTDPAIDQVIVGCACDIIRRYKPDVMFLHPTNLDAYRHHTGLFNDKILEGIRETDQWIGQVMEAVRDAGQLEETNLVLTSDHGQMDIKRIMNLNVVLADHGLIDRNEDGTFNRWDAWCLSGGMSALVYLRNPDDREIYDKTYGILCKMAEEGIYGISQVFTTEEAREKYHLSGPFSFVVESDDFSSFGEGINHPIGANFDLTDYRLGRATHGYLPFKGPQPVFVAKGPDFNENVVLETGRLIDEAPTYAKLLGVELPGADGRAIEEFLRRS